MFYLCKCPEHMGKTDWHLFEDTSNHKTDGTKTGKAYAQLLSGLPNF